MTRAQSSDLPRSTPAAEGISTEAVINMVDSMLAMQGSDFHHLMIVRHGKVVAEVHPAPFRAEDSHTVFSVSKTVTALAVGLAIDENQSIESDIYHSILNDKLHLNEGMFMENIVAQALRANGHRLFFHSFYKKDNDKNRYEVDFLIRQGRKISPVEVKSSGYSTHTSLDCLMEKHSKTLGRPYILYTRDLKKEGNILFLPIYMAMCL